ncbi:hypothetical protein U9M48_039050 [Paspalum notatum var. saurae]|uniref:Uncharacterized protein n=1 Tax=Paspalum notatum var. saurae TaxID=547442 RepID=A0AAQ3XE71_PASNO
MIARRNWRKNKRNGSEAGDLRTQGNAGGGSVRVRRRWIDDDKQAHIHSNFRSNGRGIHAVHSDVEPRCAGGGLVCLKAPGRVKYDQLYLWRGGLGLCFQVR